MIPKRRIDDLSARGAGDIEGSRGWGVGLGIVQDERPALEDVDGALHGLRGRAGAARQIDRTMADHHMLPGGDDSRSPGRQLEDRVVAGRPIDVPVIGIAGAVDPHPVASQWRRRR